MSTTKRASIALIAMAVVAHTASANVSPTNGDFFVGYTDILYKDGFGLQLLRVYNSKTPFSGAFGAGWGTDFEAHLTEQTDGTVTVQEYGGGASVVFAPPAFSQEELERTVASIVAARQKDGALHGAALTRYGNDLRTNIGFRNDEWARLARAGQVAPRKMPVGARLRSDRYGFAYIVKVANGYVCTQIDKIREFDIDGHLRRVTDKRGHSIALSYDDARHLRLVVDDLGHKLQLSYDDDGHVTSVTGDGSVHAEYRYQGQELVYSKDMDGNVYRYQYDTHGRHDMTRVGYSDATELQLEYGSIEGNENVRAVRLPDGTLLQLAYLSSPSAPLSYAVDVISSKGGAPSSHLRDEITSTRTATGEERIERVVTTLDGARLDTTYTSTCGQPKRIAIGDEVFTYDYDDHAKLTRKETPTDVFEFTYDGFDRIEHVVKRHRADAHSPLAVALTIDYRYDGGGRLLGVVTSKGKALALSYDAGGTFKSATDGGKPTVADDARPTWMAVDELGARQELATRIAQWRSARSLNAPVCRDSTTLPDVRPLGVDLGL